MRRIILVLMFLLFVFSAFSAVLDTVKMNKWVDSVFNSLSDDDRLGQLFMVAAYPKKDDKFAEELKEQINKFCVGGLIFFQGGPVKMVQQVNQYQSIAKIPMLIAMDAEWGPAMRLDSCIRFPRQMMLGAMYQDSLIYLMGAEVARQLKMLGVHISFSPVVDINNNSCNPVISSRSFSEDHKMVNKNALAYMRGLQDNGILAVAKHFPGHGDTQSDSHKTLPLVSSSRERIDTLELFPFKQLISAGVQGVMVGHLYVPALDSTKKLPSSLSGKIVKELLLDSLHFNGLVFTDALGMKGVTQNFDPIDIIIKAFNAGNDILLMPDDLPKAFSALRKEIRKENISMDEVNRRCKKILTAKYKAGLAEWKPLPVNNLYLSLNTSDAKYLNRQLVEKSITLLRNTDSIIPIKNLLRYKTASVSINADKTTRFQEALSWYDGVRNFNLSKEALKIEFDNTLSNLGPYNLVFVALHNVSDNPVSMYGLSPLIFDFISSLADRANVILTVFGSPYSLTQLKNLSKLRAVIMAYDDIDESQELAAQLIYGGITSVGKLPVSVPGVFNAGTGLSVKPIRVKFTMPEELGISTTSFYKVDSIIYNAISNKAFPGCQLLVAKNGKVIINRSYGYHTYLNRRPVLNSDIYDIASITKITATVPALMKLYNSGSIDLDKRLGDYLPYLDTTNKGKLELKDILTHQAGFVPWIPFYTSTFEPLYPGESLFSKTQSDAYPFKIDKGKYLNRNYKFKDSIYASDYSDLYPVQVAENLYLHKSYRDTIYQKINKSELRKKEYKYSDLGFYYLKDIVESIICRPLDEYIYDSLYLPLGTSVTGYLPLKRINRDRIVPTENDVVFRKQLLQGYVHDQGAAMLGGVAGSAGVFSNATDLVKIMQMYLNKGEYGGVRFFNSSTVELFTGCQFCNRGNRRGLGFDRPEYMEKVDGPVCKCVSPSSFGHTGFTGTIVWADPQNGLIYIFLSNRVYPDQYNDKILQLNVRPSIQQELYRILGNK